MNAYLLIRTEPHYRFESFAAGLKAVGFTVHTSVTHKPTRDDTLIVWNRYGHFDHAAQSFEKAGGRVLVAENGIVGKDGQGRQLYQLCRQHHAGHGSWHVGDEDRWSPLGIDIKPWRSASEGKYALICEQRGIGVAPVASPMGFASNIAAQLKDVPHRVRLHPESYQAKGTPQRPLEADLADARCVVVWTSTVGVKALIEGIPVIYQARRWIAEGAATNDLNAARRPELLCRSDEARLAALRRLAWSQWTVDEIAAGTPFRFLCM